MRAVVQDAFRVVTRYSLDAAEPPGPDRIVHLLMTCGISPRVVDGQHDAAIVGSANDSFGISKVQRQRLLGQDPLHRRALENAIKHGGVRRVWGADTDDFRCRLDQHLVDAGVRCRHTPAAGALLGRVVAHIAHGRKRRRRTRVVGASMTVDAGDERVIGKGRANLSTPDERCSEHHAVEGTSSPAGRSFRCWSILNFISAKIQSSSLSISCICHSGSINAAVRGVIRFCVVMKSRTRIQ